MIVSSGFLAVLVTVAMAVTAIAPLALLALLFRDWLKRSLW